MSIQIAAELLGLRVHIFLVVPFQPLHKVRVKKSKRIFFSQQMLIFHNIIIILFFLLLIFRLFRLFVDHKHPFISLHFFKTCTLQFPFIKVLYPIIFQVFWLILILHQYHLLLYSRPFQCVRQKRLFLFVVILSVHNLIKEIVQIDQFLFAHQNSFLMSSEDQFDHLQTKKNILLLFLITIELQIPFNR